MLRVANIQINSKTQIKCCYFFVVQVVQLTI